MLIWLAVILSYFVPAVNALLRGHKNAGAITALNLLLGWTLIGWVAAFVWSCIPCRGKDANGHRSEADGGLPARRVGSSLGLSLSLSPNLTETGFGVIPAVGMATLVFVAVVGGLVVWLAPKTVEAVLATKPTSAHDSIRHVVAEEPPAPTSRVRHDRA